MTARLALLRWVLRLVARERRQHALIIALIAFGIMTSATVATAIIRLADPAAESLRLRGNAEAAAEFGVNDPAAIDAITDAMAQASAAHPGLELVTRSAETAEGLVLVTQDPAAPLGRPWLDLAVGRWPAEGEVALTSRATDRLEAVTGTRPSLGSTVDVGGEERVVVGFYDDPTRLHDAMGLVSTGELDQGSTIQMLAPAPADQSTFAPLLALATDGRSGAPAPLFWASSYSGGLGEPADSSGPTVAAYLIGAVLCLQVAVLASAGFTVLANRRSRQLGVLSALGATPGQLGSVMVSTGLVVGLAGTAIGLVLAIVVSIGLTPLLQPLVPYRLTPTDLPWRYLVPMVPLGLVTATGGAWWPARRIRSTSAVAAIVDRQGRRRGFRRSLLAGVILLVAGGVAMTFGAPRNAPLPIVAGVLGTVVGGLLLAPAAAVLFGAIAGPAPLAVRIAWRDISRNQARSAAAIGAAAMAIGLPFGLASFVASIAHTWQPGVPDNVAQVQAPPSPDGGTTLPPSVRRVAAITPEARLVPLLMVVDRAARDLDDPLAVYPFAVTWRRSNGELRGLSAAVATPELLDLMGIEPPGPDVDVITTIDAHLDLDPSIVVEHRLEPQPYGYPEVLVLHDLPGMTMTDTFVASWMLVNDRPFTPAERDRLAAPGPASEAGPNGWPTTVTLSDGRPPFVAIRSIAVLVGGLFGLAAVAAAVALIRTESTGDSRVLTIVGAAPGTSRGVGAATVWALTLASALIAVVTAFATLAGVYLNPDESFQFVVPWAELATVLVLVPLVGATAGWLVTSTRTGYGAAPAPARS